jgi:hypothetical protein
MVSFMAHEAIKAAKTYIVAVLLSIREGNQWARGPTIWALVSVMPVRVR